MKTNITEWPSPQNIKRTWYYIDATGMVLGRLCTVISGVLLGKQKPTFSPHIDCGDFVVVTNAAQIRVTGAKRVQKTKFSHSGYPGGARYVQFGELLDKKPEKALFLAVKGMLPKNKTRKRMLTRLRIFKDGAHTHDAQKLVQLELS